MRDDQCDQIGRFWKGLGEKISFQRDFLGYFRNCQFLVNTDLTTFGQFWESIGLLFSLKSGHTGDDTTYPRLKLKILSNLLLMEQALNSLVQVVVVLVVGFQTNSPTYLASEPA